MPTNERLDDGLMGRKGLKEVINVNAYLGKGQPNTIDIGLRIVNGEKHAKPVLNGCWLVWRFMLFLNKKKVG